jgi:hypothetical protein
MGDLQKEEDTLIKKKTGKNPSKVTLNQRLRVCLVAWGSSDILISTEIYQQFAVC